jgi:FtsP/CotA-like multicopper oxidase with cupredoxin domain
MVLADIVPQSSPGRNGQKYGPTASPMTKVRVGTHQHWRIVNDTHGIHQVHFPAYAANGTRLRNPLWLDTVNVPVGGPVDMIMDFTNPIIKECPFFIVTFLNHEDKGDGEDSVPVSFLLCVLAGGTEAVTRPIACQDAAK